MNRFVLPLRNSVATKLSLVAALTCSTALPVMLAAESNTCYAPDGETEISCPASSSDVAVVLGTGANTERATTTAGAGFDEIGYSLSIEDETIAGAEKPVTSDRARDRALARSNVQVRFDGLEVRPRLNVSTTDLRSSYRAGETVTLRTSTNYPNWISRSEIIIRQADGRSNRVLQRIPVSANGTVQYAMPADRDEITYTLRVYDERGRYNETAPLPLTRTTDAFPTHETEGGATIAAGEGEDRTAVAGIPLYGGAVTATGTAEPGTQVRVLGETAIVDENGKFVLQRILPPGDHDVEVVLQQGGRLERINRSVEIPKNDWFYVGIVDVTASKKLDDELNGTIEEQSGVDVDGRIAFYLKGRVNGRTTVTASADTGNGDISDIFNRLDDKDPRQTLKRLDPHDTYLTYGDDSFAYDDTPTSGRFYVRIDRDNSHALWGDFDAGLSSGELLVNNRRLYGAKVQYNSLQTTGRGESQVQVTAYAAEADTRPQTDVLRGTGGSAYFLSRQDINGASETVRIEVVDEDSGRVISRRNLIAGRDYSIDYIQGVIILKETLGSTRTDGGVVTENPLGDYAQNLVVDYEYTPGVGEIDGSSVGGSVAGWVTDDLRLQFTGLKDTTDTADIEIFALSARYVVGSESWIEGEIAESTGTGLGSSLSTDGGLTYAIVGGGAATDRGKAYRLETYLDAKDLGLARDGHLGAYFERREAGFSRITSTLTTSEEVAGIYGQFALSDQVDLRFAGEHLSRGNGFEETEANVELAYKFDPNWTGEIGVLYSDRDDPAVGARSGERTDLGLRLTYAPDADQSYYVFGQATVERTGNRRKNDRFGVGAKLRLSEKVTVAGEISDGSLGEAGFARINYQPTADNEVYFGYTLDPSRTIAGSTISGEDKGVFVLGTKYRYSERINTFAENTFDLFGDRKSVTEVYGVTYTPDSKWTVTGGLEFGDVSDPIGGDFDRRAYSIGATYVDEDYLKAGLRFEYRDEDGDGVARDRETWLASGGVEYKIDEEWRVLGTVDALVSDSDQSAFRDGRYVEVGVGFAYRPILNNKWNTLFKLSYLDDQPGEDQVNANGEDDNPAQRSVILSFDTIYDVNEKLSLGFKYGYRHGEIAPRGTSNFTDSTAHLAVLRADWHVVHKWDVLGEIRHLYTEETSTRETGFLAGVYRHVGNNAKVGLGYEWGSVSDSVADIDYDSSGVFVNVIAKF